MCLIKVRFNHYDYVPRSSITTNSESIRRRRSFERNQARRKSSTTSSETAVAESESDNSDSWSTDTDRSISTRNPNDLEYPHEFTTQERGTSPIPQQQTTPTSKNNYVKRTGLRLGWTPSLGPQTSHYENVPVDLKSFSPDTRI